MTADAALALLNAGDAAGALALLDDAVPPGEPDTAWLVARGMVQLANDHPAEALTALRTAVALGDTMPATLLNLALAEDKAGDPARARHLMEALEHHLPEWDEPPLRLAESLRAAAKFHDAELAYGRTLEINPRREAALLGLGGLLIMRGEAEAARKLLLRCCDIAPARAEAWDTLGRALMQTDDKPLAEAAFAEAQRLSPHTLEYALHRVGAALAAGTGEPLLACLLSAADNDPLNPALPTARGVLLERLGRRSQSIDALETAAALAPEAQLPAALLGELLARANRLDEAEATLRHAIELDPGNHHLANARATVLFRMQRHADARAELLASIERNGEQVTELCQSCQCHHMPRPAAGGGRPGAARHRARPGGNAAAAHTVQRAAVSRWYHWRRNACRAA